MGTRTPSKGMLVGSTIRGILVGDVLEVRPDPLCPDDRDMDWSDFDWRVRLENGTVFRMSGHEP
jgi:hypothetical protein